MEAAAKIIEALAHLVGAVAWPIAVAVIAYLFGPAVRSFLADFSEGSVKGFGVEASAKKVAVASIALAQASLASKPPAAGSDPELTAESPSDTLEQSVRLITNSSIRASARKSILWVDDKPEGNINERKALRAIGFNITNAQTTDNGIAYLKDGNIFDLIISDLMRPEGDRAGFDLLDQAKKIAPNTPLIIYSGLYKNSLKEEAISKGAYAYTSNPAKLVEIILRASKVQSVFD